MTTRASSTKSRFGANEVFLIAILALLYIMLMGKFRPFDMDLPWMDSWAHALLVDHTCHDNFRHEVFPSGPGGTVAFGTLAAVVQGVPQMLLGWSAGVDIATNVFLVLLSLWLLQCICIAIGFNRQQTLCALAFAGLMEPLVKSATSGRYEPLTLLLLTASMLLALRGWAFVAALLACVSVEIQPIASLVPLSIAVILWQTAESASERYRRVQRFCVAALVSCCLYFALHSHILTTVRTADWHLAARKAFPGGFVPEYFVHYPRHVVLLLFVGAAAWALWRTNKAAFAQWPWLCLAGAVVVSAALRSANQAYMTLLMPMLALVVVAGLYRPDRGRILLACIALVTLPQYAYRWYYGTVQHPTLSQQDQNRLGAAINQAAVAVGRTPQTVRIAGDSHLWFSHPDHYEALALAVLTPHIFNSVDLLVCSDTTLDPVTQGGVRCNGLTSVSRPLSDLALRGYHIQIRQRTHSL